MFNLTQWIQENSTMYNAAVDSLSDAMLEADREITNIIARFDKPVPPSTATTTTGPYTDLAAATAAMEGMIAADMAHKGATRSGNTVTWMEVESRMASETERMAIQTGIGVATAIGVVVAAVGAVAGASALSSLSFIGAKSSAAASAIADVATATRLATPGAASAEYLAAQAYMAEQRALALLEGVAETQAATAANAARIAAETAKKLAWEIEIRVAAVVEGRIAQGRAATIAMEDASQRIVIETLANNPALRAVARADYNAASMALAEAQIGIRVSLDVARRTSAEALARVQNVIRNINKPQSTNPATQHWY